MLDGAEVFGHVGHGVAQALMLQRMAARQFQLQPLVGGPEQCTAPMQRELVLQAVADRGKNRVWRRAYGVRAWLAPPKGAPVNPTVGVLAVASVTATCAGRSLTVHTVTVMAANAAGTRTCRH